MSRIFIICLWSPCCNSRCYPRRYYNVIRIHNIIIYIIFMSRTRARIVCTRVRQRVRALNAVSWLARYLRPAIESSRPYRERAHVKVIHVPILVRVSPPRVENKTARTVCIIIFTVNGPRKYVNIIILSLHNVVCQRLHTHAHKLWITRCSIHISL